MKKRNKDNQVEFVEALLTDDDGRSEEGRAMLEAESHFIGCALLRRLRSAIQLHEDDVAIALARGLCEKYAQRDVGIGECIIYCRVSSESQAKGMGLLRQLKCCADYASIKDYAIVAVFSEVASGMDALPVRETVLRMAKARQCVILCEDASRWSRKGAKDVAPAYVLMTSEYSRELDEALMDVFERVRGQTAPLPS